MKGDSSSPNHLSGILTLMYHRIDANDTNPWSIGVSPENFEKQIRLLKENYTVITIDELIAQTNSGNIAENTVCITFDDGYADNYLHAKPILEKYNCPATFFIATAFIDQIKSFWWDELELIFLHSKKLPGQLSLHFGNEKTMYELNGDELTEQQISQHREWRWHQPPLTDRCTIFLSIWEKLTALPLAAIEHMLDEIKRWSHWKQQTPVKRLPLSSQQLQEFAANNLFKIALHTHTHCDLNQQPKEIQLKEIISCKDFLHDELHIESSYFSYPFGRYNADTIQVVQELGLTACFTAETIQSNTNSNELLLGRYQPFDWNEYIFQQKLDDWFTNKAQVMDIMEQ